MQASDAQFHSENQANSNPKPNYPRSNSQLTNLHNLVSVDERNATEPAVKVTASIPKAMELFIDIERLLELPTLGILYST